MRVDLARHVVNAYNLINGADKQDVLIRLKVIFPAEWDQATDPPAGELLN